jgi:hypothetical protein
MLHPDDQLKKWDPVQNQLLMGKFGNINRDAAPNRLDNWNPLKFPSWYNPKLSDGDKRVKLAIRAAKHHGLIDDRKWEDKLRDKAVDVVERLYYKNARSDKRRDEL